jgi:uncharacterized protein YyaL (SSP411 family)
MKDDHDGAEPSGNSIMALALLRLSSMLGREDFRRSAENTLRAFASRMQSQASSVPQMVVAFLHSLTPPKQIMLAGERAALSPMLELIRRHFLPDTAVMLADERYPAIEGKSTAYVCENFACRLPTTDPPKLEELLTNLTSSSV